MSERERDIYIYIEVVSLFWKRDETSHPGIDVNAEHLVSAVPAASVATRIHISASVREEALAQGKL